MKRTESNLLVDFLAALLFVGMIATGYILRFPLPPGTNKSLVLWGMSRHEWGAVHFGISLGLLAILLTHLALHWQWVVVTVTRQLGLTSKSQNRHLGVGLLTLVVVASVLGLFAWVTRISVTEREDPFCPPSESSVVAEPTVAPAATIPSDREHSQVSFWEEVFPILETSCLRCHGPRRAEGGFRVDRREDYFGMNGKEPLIVPGQSNASPLIAIVSGLRSEMAMAARHKLPEREVDVLRRWIAEGAEWLEKHDAK